MNINQWYLVAQEFMSNYGGNNGYVRAYARYTQQDTENVRTYVETQCRFYVEQYYVTSGKPTGGSITLPKIEVVPPVTYAENLLIYKNGAYLDTNVYVKNNGQFFEGEVYRKVNGQFIK